MGDIAVIGVEYPKQMNRWACLKTDSSVKINLLSEPSKTCAFITHDPTWNERKYLECNSIYKRDDGVFRLGLYKVDASPTGGMIVETLLEAGGDKPSWIVVECGKIQIERVK